MIGTTENGCQHPLPINASCVTSRFLIGSDAMTLKDALKHFGSRNKIAKALGIKRQAVTRWKDGIPLLRQCQIELLTSGKLKRAKA